MMKGGEMQIRNFLTFAFFAQQLNVMPWMTFESSKYAVPCCLFICPFRANIQNIENFAFIRSAAKKAGS